MSAPNAAALTGTLAQPFVLARLGWYATASESSRRLRAMFARRLKPLKPRTPDTEAILEGYCATKQQADDHLEALRERGALLFAWHGSAAIALAMAQKAAA